MKSFLLSILALFIFSTTSWSQLVLRGVVIDDNTQKPLQHVLVENKENKNYAYTDAQGSFIINATKGQTITFFHSGFELTVLKFEEENKKVQVSLVPLNTLPKGASSLSAYQKDSTQRRKDYAIILNREKDKIKMTISPTSLVITNPISSWLQYIMPESKMRLRFQKNFQKWEQQKFINARYNAALVSSITKLNNEQAERFIGEHPMTYDYARAVSDVELKMWISNRYKNWRH